MKEHQLRNFHNKTHMIRKPSLVRTFSDRSHIEKPQRHSYVILMLPRHKMRKEKKAKNMSTEYI